MRASGEGQATQILLRPEDLKVADGPGRVSGRVETSAFFGSYYELRIDTPLGLIRMRDKAAGSPGQVVEVTWPEQAGIAYAAEGEVQRRRPAPEGDRGTGA